MTSLQLHTKLVRLLDALGEEIAATTDEEIRQTCAEYGRPVRSVAGEVERLLASMIDDPTLSPAELYLPRLVRSPEQRRRH
jgi:hypothetical protein